MNSTLGNRNPALLKRRAEANQRVKHQKGEALNVKAVKEKQ
jgi:hypothetical protein